MKQRFEQAFQFLSNAWQHNEKWHFSNTRGFSDYILYCASLCAGDKEFVFFWHYYAPGTAAGERCILLYVVQREQSY